MVPPPRVQTRYRPTMAVQLRPATKADLPSIQRTLFLALTWDGVPDTVTFEMAMAHPEVGRYHLEWGRPGDVGVIAEDGDAVVGTAFGRLFTEHDRGHGYVDQRTPEIAIAVEPDRIGEGIGTRMLDALEGAYRATGVEQLSLSVNLANPAMRLYERFGYTEVDRDDDSARMLKLL